MVERLVFNSPPVFPDTPSEISYHICSIHVKSPQQHSSSSSCVVVCGDALAGGRGSWEYTIISAPTLLASFMKTRRCEHEVL